jgi:hypothetical protein
VRDVQLNGHTTAYRLVTTARGTEVHVTGNGSTSSLRVSLR